MQASATLPRLPRPRIPRPAQWFGVLVVLVLLMASVWVWSVVRAREDTVLFDRHLARAEAVNQSLKQALDSIDQPLHWNADFFDTVGAVSQERFRSFNTPILDREPAILMMEWTPRVAGYERAAFVAQARREGQRSYEILQPGSQGLLEKAPVTDLYLPVLYTVARQGADTANGLNVSFTEERMQWYEISARQDSLVTTGTIPVFDSVRKASRPGLVHSRPLYTRKGLSEPEARWKHLRGWVAAVVTLEELFVSAVDPYLSPEFDVYVVEQSARGRFIIGQRSLHGARVSSLPNVLFVDHPADLTRSIQVGESVWTVVLRPTPVWSASASHGESLLALLLGLGFSALVAWTFRLQQVQRRVAQAMQDEIAAREELLRDVTNDVPIAVFQARTLEGDLERISFVSAQVGSLLGVSVDAVMQDTRECYRHVVSVPVSEGGAYIPTQVPVSLGQSASFLVRWGDQELWVEQRSMQSPQAKSGTGVITGYWADITAQKRREQQLSQAKEALETSHQTLVSTIDELERTRSALLQSEKLAALGTLVAGLSHELNTPLGNALLMASALQDQLRTTETAFNANALKRKQLEAFFADALASAQLAVTSVEKAATLVHHFKQTAVDQAAQQRSVFSLLALCRDACAGLRSALDGKSLRLEIDMGSDIAMDSFPVPLEQVLHALVTNSMHHAFAGRPAGTIRISAHWREPGSHGNEVMLVVEDDGNGIAADVLGRIFDPFFTTRMGRNIGIGLNLVYRLTTTVLGGTIAVDSEQDRGTRFVLCLPAIAPHTV